MQVDPEILNCTVFLGRPVEHGFCADGTGFFLRIEFEQYLINPQKSRRDSTPNEEPIYIRTNKKHGGVYIHETRRCDWYRHQNWGVDVCVYPVDLRAFGSFDDLEVGFLTEGIIFDNNVEQQFGKLALGDDIFIASCFVGCVGEKKNIPIVRIASIAAMPSEPIGG